MGGVLCFFFFFFLKLLYLVPSPEKKTVGEKCSMKELFLAPVARPAVYKADRGTGCTLQDARPARGGAVSFNSRTELGAWKLPPWITVRVWDVSSEAWGDGSLCDSWRRGEDRTAWVILACQIVMEGRYTSTPTSNAPSPLVLWPYTRCPHPLGLFKPSPNQLSGAVLICRSLGIIYLGGDDQDMLLTLTTAWEEQVTDW